MSDCNVCLDASYCEFAEVLVKKEVKARKEYRCCECNRPIPKDSVYQLAKMLYDGGWDTWRTCMVCAELRAAFYCNGEVWGCFWDEMREYSFDEMTTGCLQRLKTPEAKAYLLERWNEWKGLRD